MVFKQNTPDIAEQYYTVKGQTIARVGALVVTEDWGIITAELEETLAKMWAEKYHVQDEEED